MKHHVRGVAVTLTMLAAMLPAGPATAVASAPGDLWPNPAPCATGAFTGHTGNSPGSQRLHLVLSGWAATCPDAKGRYPTGEQFGFAYYSWYDKVGATGRVVAFRLRTYDNPTGPTSFSDEYDFAFADEDDPDATAICVMRDPQTRLACVEVTVTVVGTPVVTPLSNDDPKVSGPAQVVTTDKQGHPIDGGCGTCL